MRQTLDGRAKDPHLAVHNPKPMFRLATAARYNGRQHKRIFQYLNTPQHRTRQMHGYSNSFLVRRTKLEYIDFSNEGLLGITAGKSDSVSCFRAANFGLGAKIIQTNLNAFFKSRAAICQRVGGRMYFVSVGEVYKLVKGETNHQLRLVAFHDLIANLMQQQTSRPMNRNVRVGTFPLS
jgi:hypothetical protein